MESMVSCTYGLFMHGLESKLLSEGLSVVEHSISRISIGFVSAFISSISPQDDDVYWVNYYAMAPIVEYLRYTNTQSTIVFSFRTPFLYGLRQSLTELDSRCGKPYDGR